MKILIVVLVIGAVGLAISAFVLGLRWEVEGRDYIRAQERLGATEKERIARQGDVFISEQIRRGTEEGVRRVNSSRIEGSLILANAEVTAKNEEKIADITASDYFIRPYLEAHGKYTSLQREREKITDPEKRRTHDLLLHVMKMTREDATQIQRNTFKCIEEVRKRSIR